MPDQASKDVLDYAAIQGNRVQIEFRDGTGTTVSIKREGSGYITEYGRSFTDRDVKKARHDGLGFAK